MTYSICVREPAPEADGTGFRYGVAAATRLPAVGSVCPHVSAHGAVAVAGVVDGAVGESLLADLAAGRPVEDALGERAGDEAATRRQCHGVGAASGGADTGADCPTHAAHRVGDGYTVAGTSMAEEGVLDALERGYRENERSTPLPSRLLTALAAGERAGGDRRTDLPVGSAAVVVATPGRGEPLYHDLRVDASDSPVTDLRETYRRAKRGYEAALDRYDGDQTENS